MNVIQTYDVVEDMAVRAVPEDEEQAGVLFLRLTDSFPYVTSTQDQIELSFILNGSCCC